MDIKTIKACHDLAMSGQISFAVIVVKLTAGGVQYYIVDLVGRQKNFYGAARETFTCVMDFEGPEIPKTLDTTAMNAAITDIRQGNIKYREFLRRIMAAGCSHYEAFMLGKKTIYMGRDGSQYDMPFPEAK